MPFSLLFSAIAFAPLLIVAAVVASCAPLTVYNTLLPADSGSSLGGRDIAYGQNARQRLDVYVPTAKAAAAPVVVFFYGGSWNSGRKEDYAFVGKALASHGFVTIVADYRVVPEVRFPAFIEDGAAAVVWAQANAAKFGGDAQKVFLLGHSAGAYIAAMIGLDGRYLRAVGSSPERLKGVAALAGPYNFLPLDVASTREAFGRSSDLAATQPINYASRKAPPMLLATGAADDTVKPRNSERLAEKLRSAGADVTLRKYDDLGHVGILLALSVTLRGRAPVLDDVVQFFDQHATR